MNDGIRAALAEKIRNLTDESGNHPAVIIGTLSNSPSPHEDRICVSTDDGCLFADLFGHYRGGRPWIHPVLESFAEMAGTKTRKFHWEWANAGGIELCED